MSPTLAHTVRSLLTTDGIAWTVSELAVTTLRGVVTFLFFESETVVCRVRNFPVRWFELPDDELAALGNGR